MVKVPATSFALPGFQILADAPGGHAQMQLPQRIAVQLDVGAVVLHVLRCAWRCTGYRHDISARIVHAREYDVFTPDNILQQEFEGVIVVAHHTVGEMLGDEMYGFVSAPLGFFKNVLFVCAQGKQAADAERDQQGDEQNQRDFFAYAKTDTTVLLWRGCCIAHCAG